MPKPQNYTTDLNPINTVTVTNYIIITFRIKHAYARFDDVCCIFLVPYPPTCMAFNLSFT